MNKTVTNTNILVIFPKTVKIIAVFKAIGLNMVKQKEIDGNQFDQIAGSKIICFKQLLKQHQYQL